MSNSNWLGLTNRVYIVTVGSSRIGAAIVQELLNDGAYVCNADLQAGDEQAQRYTYVQMDVTAPADVDNLVAQVQQDRGRLDGLVNNADINLPRLLVDPKDPHGKYEFKVADFEKMFSVNVKSVFLMVQAVGPDFSRSRAWDHC